MCAPHSKGTYPCAVIAASAARLTRHRGRGHSAVGASGPVGGAAARSHRHRHRQRPSACPGWSCARICQRALRRHHQRRDPAAAQRRPSSTAPRRSPATPADRGRGLVDVRTCRASARLTVVTGPATSITQIAHDHRPSRRRTRRPVGQVDQINVIVAVGEPERLPAHRQRASCATPTAPSLQTMGLTPAPGHRRSPSPTSAGRRRATGTFFFQATYNGDSQRDGLDLAAGHRDRHAERRHDLADQRPSTMTQGVPVTLIATVVPDGRRRAPSASRSTARRSARRSRSSTAIATFVWTPNVGGQVTLGASYTTNQGGSGSTTDSRRRSCAGPTQHGRRSPWSSRAAARGTRTARYTLGNGTVLHLPGVDALGRAGDAHRHRPLPGRRA